MRRQGRTLLGPIDLAVDRGAFWGVVGPNGAGKSTLLRALAGIDRIAAGDLDRAVDRRRLGFLFQHHDFLPELPFAVADVVAYGLASRVTIGWAGRAERRFAVDRALELLGLSGMDRRLYRELSGGERQKVQLARLVAQEAELLLLDEPAAGLDLDWQERLSGLVGELHARTGVAVVMVTHEAHHLPACCERVLLLRQGRAIAAGPPPAVFTPPLLEELYGCRMEVIERGGRYFAHSLGSTEGAGK